MTKETHAVDGITFLDFNDSESLTEAHHKQVQAYYQTNPLSENSPLMKVLGPLYPNGLTFEEHWIKDPNGSREVARVVHELNCPMSPAFEMLWLAERMHFLDLFSLGRREVDVVTEEFRAVRARVIELATEHSWLCAPCVGYRDDQTLLALLLPKGERRIPGVDYALTAEFLRTAGAQAALATRLANNVPTWVSTAVEHCDLDILLQAIKESAQNGQLVAQLTIEALGSAPSLDALHLTARLRETFAKEELGRTLPIYLEAYKHFIATGEPAFDEFASLLTRIENLVGPKRRPGSPAAHWSLLLAAERFAQSSYDPAIKTGSAPMDVRAPDFWKLLVERMLDDRLTSETIVQDLVADNHPELTLGNLVANVVGAQATGYLIAAERERWIKAELTNTTASPNAGTPRRRPRI